MFKAAIFFAFVSSFTLVGCLPAELDLGTKAAKEAITRNFKDPESAQFRDATWFNKDDPSKGVYCGSVNSKNSFGAYTGFERFIVDLSGNFLTENSADVNRNAVKPNESAKDTALSISEFVYVTENIKQQNVLMAEEIKSLKAAKASGVDISTLRTSTENERFAKAHILVFASKWRQLCSANP